MPFLRKPSRRFAALAAAFFCVAVPAVSGQTPDMGQIFSDDSALPEDDPFAPVIRTLNEGGMIYPGLNNRQPVAEGTISTSFTCDEVFQRLTDVCKANDYIYHSYPPTPGSPLGFFEVTAEGKKRSFLIFRTPDEAATLVKFSMDLPDPALPQTALVDRFPELSELGERVTDEKETMAPGAATATVLFKDTYFPEMALANADNILERAGWDRAVKSRRMKEKLGNESHLFTKGRYVLWLHARQSKSGDTFMVCQVMEQGGLTPFKQGKPGPNGRPPLPASPPPTDQAPGVMP